MTINLQSLGVILFAAIGKEIIGKGVYINNSIVSNILTFCGWDMPSARKKKKGRKEERKKSVNVNLKEYLFSGKHD